MASKFFLPQPSKCPSPFDSELIINTNGAPDDPPPPPRAGQVLSSYWWRYEQLNKVDRWSRQRLKLSSHVVCSHGSQPSFQPFKWIPSNQKSLNYIEEKCILFPLLYVLTKYTWIYFLFWIYIIFVSNLKIFFYNISLNFSSTWFVGRTKVICIL